MVVTSYVTLDYQLLYKDTEGAFIPKGKPMMEPKIIEKVKFFICRGVAGP